jgi:hypothetical protein
LRCISATQCASSAFDSRAGINTTSVSPSRYAVTVRVRRLLRRTSTLESATVATLRLPTDNSEWLPRQSLGYLGKAVDNDFVAGRSSVNLST